MQQQQQLQQIQMIQAMMAEQASKIQHHQAMQAAQAQSADQRFSPNVTAPPYGPRPEAYSFFQPQLHSSYHLISSSHLQHHIKSFLLTMFHVYFIQIIH